MAKILSVGLDVQLLYSRKLALQQTGAQVVIARAGQAMLQLESEFFDVVLLCHSLPEADTARLCRLIELFWPVTSVVQLRESLDAGQPTQHTGAMNVEDATALVNLLRNLLEDGALRRQKQPVIFAVACPAPALLPGRSLHNSQR